MKTKQKANYRLELELTPNPSEHFSHTGYGDLYCNGEKPLCIFTALRKKHSHNTSTDRAFQTSTIKLKSKVFQVAPTAHLFQDYTLEIQDKKLQLSFKGEKQHDMAPLNIELKSIEASPKKDMEWLRETLLQKSLRIEQDQFFEDEE